jgi:hypothetical protein
MSNAKRWSSAWPRDCCLVSPETAHEHGHPLDDEDLAGTDDALAQAAFKRRSRETDVGSGNSGSWFLEILAIAEDDDSGSWLRSSFMCRVR